MNKATELKKLQKSDTWKELVSKLNNKIENLETEILTAYKEENVDRTPTYSKKDRFFLGNKIMWEVMEELDDSKGAEILKEELNEQIKHYEKVITGNVVDEIWIPYSSPMFTELDLLTLKIWGYVYYTSGFLDSLISKFEKPKKVKEEKDWVSEFIDQVV